MKKIASYRYALLFIWLALTAFNLVYTLSIVGGYLNSFQTLVLLFVSFVSAIIVALIWIGNLE